MVQTAQSLSYTFVVYTKEESLSPGDIGDAVLIMLPTALTWISFLVHLMDIEETIPTVPMLRNRTPSLT